jgi:hypothetical protein
MVAGPIKKYKTAESMHKAVMRMNKADKERKEAGKAKIPMTRAEGKRYDDSIKKQKEARKKLDAANKRASRSRSSSKKYENQK